MSIPVFAVISFRRRAPTAPTHCRCIQPVCYRCCQAWHGRDLDCRFGGDWLQQQCSSDCEPSPASQGDSLTPDTTQEEFSSGLWWPFPNCYKSVTALQAQKIGLKQEKTTPWIAANHADR